MVDIMTAKEMVKVLVKQTLDLYADGVENVNICVQPITKNFKTRCQKELNGMMNELRQQCDRDDSKMTLDKYMLLSSAIISVKSDIAKADIRN